MLKCENISKIYNDNSWFSKKESIKVLENISFHLKQGRSMGFVNYFLYRNLHPIVNIGIISNNSPCPPSVFLQQCHGQ